MKRLKQKTLAYILALPLVYGTASLPQPAWAGAEREPEAIFMIIDGLVVRPISLVATLDSPNGKLGLAQVVLAGRLGIGEGLA